MMSKPEYFVTKPYLPPLEEVTPLLEEIWNSKNLTNNGPFHRQLEAQLGEYLGVEHLSLFTNATIALVTALQALKITGEVITTPYSFVATSHSLLWNNIRPVFVDIDPKTCNLDAAKIEAAITPQTTAIMPVHCYGYPCDVEKIQKIADIYGLKVIYDAAHAFGVQYKNQSILSFGDLSILSFHATKVFNTFEGGAIICPDLRTKQRIDYLKNFGFADEVTVMAPGINGKMSEFNAALGLIQLKHIDDVLEKRRDLETYYRNKLKNVCGIRCLERPVEAMTNSSYFPIFIGQEAAFSRDELYNKLKENHIHARRYFFPLISDMPMYRIFPSTKPENLPNAIKVSQEVLCLPIYPDLETSVIDQICEIILEMAG